ncbi:MAG TPA: 4-(cytidine 5'-diphospho)-2-C-methyl-D-erythritol kinase [Bacteroidia bacterium]|jgi:4-diphosphocytidyl-2-C-methyl-D-erythritol kinase|nr:4-(cytidine 5'-diphospho)-2-C-methyl-D-erythritol kinase [Bacteroidia bacterium]
MIVFPNAKINIGLRILEKRADGYHNIESIFYPVGWCDVLEAVKIEGHGKIKLHLSGIPVPGRRNDDNLCVKLYKLIAKKHKLPSLDIWLHKAIPIGAGLGGGSSDAAHFIKMLNEMCELNLSIEEMKEYVSMLGSDCVFFIENKPVIATSRGEVTEAIDVDLSHYYISIVYPEILISTPYAYGLVSPNSKGDSLKKSVSLKNIKDWKNNVVNDFEAPILKNHPAIGDIKETLYKEGAIYAAMSGSGSAVYGIFEKKPDLAARFPSYKIWTGDLKTPK